MISVRESVFETNSSSCHSLTIAKKSFLDKLKNGEVFYKGKYDCYSDSDEVFINDLSNVSEEDVLTIDQVKELLKEWLKKTPTSDYEKELQDQFKEVDLDSKPLQEIVDDIYGESVEDFASTYLLKGSDIEPSYRILGNEDYESSAIWSKEIPLPDGDVEVIKLLSISC